MHDVQCKSSSLYRLVASLSGETFIRTHMYSIICNDLPSLLPQGKLRKKVNNL